MSVLSTLNVALLQLLIDIALVGAILVIAVMLVKFIAQGIFDILGSYKQYKSGTGNVLEKKLPYKLKRGENYVQKALLTAVGAAVLFIGMAIIANKQWGLAISPDNVVLTFVGILATFIVVTNYAQVLDIKSELKDEIRKLDKRTDALYKRPKPNDKNNKTQQS